MTYFFILGNNPSLSFLEIYAVLKSNAVLFSIIGYGGKILLLKTDCQLPLSDFQARLGGTIKIGRILPYSFPLEHAEECIPVLVSILTNRSQWKKIKIQFGLSVYTVPQKGQKVSHLSISSKKLMEIGLTIKKLLRNAGYSSRFISAQHSHTLSSVQVSKNKLLGDSGKEYIFIEHNGAYLIGNTDSVQGFEDYSFRDWQRPHRDMKTGLLPPKLAQILINITGITGIKSKNILDPFCGFGTIIQEALLLEYTNVRGSDIEKKNVAATQENLAWFSEKKKISFKDEWIMRCDATKLTLCYTKNSIDSIVTEPYLGPIRPHQKTPINSIIGTITNLYLSFFREAYFIMRKNGVISIVWPVWINAYSTIFLPIYEDVLKIGYKNITIPETIGMFFPEKTARGSLLYHREGQHIAREIFVFQKK